MSKNLKRSLAQEGNGLITLALGPEPGTHPTKEDLDLMYSFLYDDISAENAKEIIHILDYGTP